VVWTASMDTWQQIKALDNLLRLLNQKSHNGQDAKNNETDDLGEPADEWYYLNQNAEQEGPVSKEQLCNMLRTKVLDIGSYTWKEGMADWVPLSESPDFAALCSTIGAAPPPPCSLTAAISNSTVLGGSHITGKSKIEEPIWHYADKYRTKKGPVTSVFLGQQYAIKEINQDTLVWKAGLAGWQRLKEIPELVSMVSGLNTKEDEKAKKREKKKQEKKKRKEKSQSRDDQATSVYITGLPPDITSLDLFNHFKKAGIIVDGPEPGAPQIKIFTDDNGVPKGDATVTYLKEESVGLAIQFLNDSFVRPNIKIKVQKADSKNESSKFLRKKAKLNPIERNHVTLKHMFHPNEAEGDPNFYKDLKVEIVQECEKKCGKINKINVFDGNEDGVVAIKFNEASAAEKCISIMNGRFFGGRQIVCRYFDGHPNY